MTSFDLAAGLAALDAAGLRRMRRIMTTPQGPRAIVDGCNYLTFCSNDYLGLANHPRVVAAAQQGAERYGVGAGASHLISGHSLAHHVLEKSLAQFVGHPRALLFSSGYMANLSAITALVGRGDTVFSDKLNHASLNDAVRLSCAKFKRYPHRNVVALDRMLAESRKGRKIIATDAVFSMDGDIAPLPDLLTLCEYHNAWLLIDDAHGFGVLGARGRGVLAHFKMASPRIIYMATLGKAVGVSGAFVSGTAEVIETLIQRARAYIYTTAMPPLLAHSALAALELIDADEWRRDHLQHLRSVLCAGVEDRWDLLVSSTPIQPLIIGDHIRTSQLSNQLASQGLLVPAIRPPTVPTGTARLRISLSAAHTVANVDRLVAALNDA